MNSVVADPSVYTDFSGLDKLKMGARDQSPEAVKEVARQFESMFISQMLKGMRQAKLAEGLLDNEKTEFYRDMYDQQMALKLAGKPGIGLAKMLAEHIGVNNSAEGAQENETAESTESEGMDIDAYRKRLITARAAIQQDGSAAKTASASSALEHLQRLLDQLEQAQNNRSRLWQNLEEDLDNGSSDANSSNAKQQSFWQMMKPMAIQAADQLGVDVDMLLAQAALETGWGQSVIKNGRGVSSHNLFNIKADKAWQGQQVRSMTLEIIDGIAKKEIAGFRAYETFQESFTDYVRFIKSNPRYSEALKKAGNPAGYLRELQQAGYATDPQYAQKVLMIYRDQVNG
jgi:peptidoglycan hydrolase FlgJ